MAELEAEHLLASANTTDPNVSLTANQTKVDNAVAAAKQAEAGHDDAGIVKAYGALQKEETSLGGAVGALQHDDAPQDATLIERGLGWDATATKASPGLPGGGADSPVAQVSIPSAEETAAQATGLQQLQSQIAGDLPSALTQITVEANGTWRQRNPKAAPTSAMEQAVAAEVAQGKSFSTIRRDQDDKYRAANASALVAPMEQRDVTPQYKRYEPGIAIPAALLDEAKRLYFSDASDAQIQAAVQKTLEGIAANIIRIAKSQVGLTEATNQNDGAILKFPNFFGRGSESWCNDFVSWVSTHAGVPINFSYVPTFEAWAKHDGRWTENPQPGGVYAILFTWSGSPDPAAAKPDHVGFDLGKNRNGTRKTLEGNSAPPGQAKEGVWIHNERTPNEIVGFVMLAPPPTAANT